MCKLILINFDSFAIKYLKYKQIASKFNCPIEVVQTQKGLKLVFRNAVFV